MTTSHLTFFKLFQHRDQESAQALIGKDFKGLVVTDRYGAYNWISSKQRQYCWAHLIRDIKKILDRENNQESLVGYRLKASCRSLFSYWRKIKAGSDDPFYKRFFWRTIRSFRRTLKKGQALENTKTGKFCAKLLKEWDCLWHFLRNKLVDPTNNHAERQLRHAVLWRKKSFGTQSKRGRHYVERILTCVMTCKQQGVDIILFLKNCIQEGYWQKGQYPSLVTPTGQHIK